MIEYTEENYKDLKNNLYYWAINKEFKSEPQLLKYMIYTPDYAGEVTRGYFSSGSVSDRLWNYPDNFQAFEKYRIFGPVEFNDKTLKAYQLHLGGEHVIDTSELFFEDSLHEDWKKYADNSGEYKDELWYSYNTQRVIELIRDGYAELVNGFIVSNPDTIYFKMRKEY